MARTLPVNAPCLKSEATHIVQFCLDFYLFIYFMSKNPQDLDSSTASAWLKVYTGPRTHTYQLPSIGFKQKELQGQKEQRSYSTPPPQSCRSAISLVGLLNSPNFQH